MYSKKLSSQRRARGGFYDQSPPPGYGGTAFLQQNELSMPEDVMSDEQPQVALSDANAENSRATESPFSMNPDKRALRDGIEGFRRILSLLDGTVRKDPRDFSFTHDPGEKPSSGAPYTQGRVEPPEPYGSVPGSLRRYSNPDDGEKGNNAWDGMKVHRGPDDTGGPDDIGIPGNAGGPGNAGIPGDWQNTGAPDAAEKIPRYTEEDRRGYGRRELSGLSSLMRGTARADSTPEASQHMAHRSGSENSKGNEVNDEAVQLVRDFFRTRYTLEELLIMGISILLASGEAEDETFLIFGLLMLLSDKSDKRED